MVPVQSENRGRVPEQLRAEHDRIMALAPVEYRGYLIKPISHDGQPYYIKGKFIYWGYIPVFLAGGHAGPGATWSQTIGGVKTMIDCLHEAGLHPPLLPHVPITPEEKAEYRVRLEYLKGWNERFWTLMRERQDP